METSSKRDLNESIIDNENLINAVEARPQLYNKSLKEYSDINIKKKLWEEICVILFVDTWGGFSATQKIQTGRLVQQRWKNIRACFSRELRAQKETKSGQAAPKRRKYVYFDKLLFLLPTMDMRETSGNAPPVEGDSEEPVEDARETRVRPKSATKKKKSYEESLLEILQKKKTEGADHKTNFALSIVPMLKALPLDKKIDAQIQILQIFKNINSNPHTTVQELQRSTYNPIMQPGPTRIQYTGPPAGNHPQRSFQQYQRVGNESSELRYNPSPSSSVQTVSPPTLSPRVRFPSSSTSLPPMSPQSPVYLNLSSPSPQHSNPSIRSFISNFSVDSNNSDEIYDIYSQDNDNVYVE